MPQHSQIDRITALVRESLYAVDESLIAEAILARASVRHHVAEASFRNDECEVQRRAKEVRSFRPTRRARSFHLIDGRRPSQLV